MVSPLQINPFEAVQSGDKATVTTLVFQGLDPYLKNTGRESLLITAARAGTEELLELLVASGCDVDDRDPLGISRA